ncbi:insulinase family protein, partial [Staphylococcus simulans]|uniref:insulinase family protein n=1 Tax=Staphylococcus simulans TaxID=1286 RepID=UPI000D41E548
MKDIELHKFDHSSFEVNICKTDKFKTINIILLSEFKYNKNLATHIALLGYIFEQGSVNFPSDNNFQVILEELYGAKIATNVTRKKDRHVVMINLEFPNGKYMDQPDLLKKVIKLLRDIFFQPVIYSSEYGEAALEKAKSNLRNKINDIENNIFLKANSKALEYLYNDKKLSTPYGDSEELNQLSLENLKAIHKAMPDISENELFFIGDVEKSIILEELEEEFKVEIDFKTVLKNSSEVKADDIIESHLEIQEGLGESGVLVLVFKINKGKDVVNTVIN